MRKENEYMSQRIYTDEEKIGMTQYLKENISIVDVAEHLGYSLLRKGQYYQMVEHDSVMLDPRKNCFWRNSTGTTGSILDFCTYFGELSLQESFTLLYGMIGGQEVIYERLYGNGYSENPKKQIEQEPLEKVKEPLVLILPEKAKTRKHVYAYLQKTRKIDFDVIQDFFDRGMLYQDEKNNCVFISYDNEGNPVFACKRGTNTTHRFVGDCPGSDYQKGFFINNQATTLFICESVIDVMSYMSLLKRGGNDYHELNYHVLNGTQKQESVPAILKENPNINFVILGLDTDKGGKKATKEILDSITDMIPCIIKQPKGKDWNDMLVNLIKNESIAKRELCLTDFIKHNKRKVEQEMTQ